MLKASRCTSLVLEAAEKHRTRLRVEREVTKRLDRDWSVEICIVRQIDVPHRT
jgi:hypothetical protein